MISFDMGKNMLIKQNNNIRFGIGQRWRGSRIGIVEVDSQGKFIKEILKSIDNLSLGESILLNLYSQGLLALTLVF